MPGGGGLATAQGSKWTLGEQSVPLLLDMSSRTDVSSAPAPGPLPDMVPAHDQQTGAREGASSPPHVYAQAVPVGGPLDAPTGAGDANKEQRSGSGHPYVAQAVGGRDTPLEIRDMDKSPVPPTIPT